MGFVFYDVETTGLNRRFDQIIQFAAIKTDANFNETDRFEIKCRLLPYIIPSPEALLVNGFQIDDLLNQSIPSFYKMSCEIQRKLSQWGNAVYVAHNSIKFDEEFLRQCFYMNLHNPFLTNSNNNSRICSLKIARALSTFSPNSIVIPEIDGKQSFKLEALAQANGYKKFSAHEALSDVEALIHLCKVIATNAEDTWSNVIRFSKKLSAQDFINNNDFFVFTEVIKNNHYTWPLTCLEQNPNYSAEMFVFDLSICPIELSELSEPLLIGRLNAYPKPVKAIRTNACPLINDFDDLPEGVLSNLDEDLLMDRVAFINSNQNFKERVLRLYKESIPEWPPSEYVEEQIYNGFLPFSEFDLLRTHGFHDKDWSDRREVLASLTDIRLRQIGNRLVYSEAVNCLPEATRKNYQLEIAKRLVSEDSGLPWLTIPQAIIEAEEILESNTNAKIIRYLDYLRDRLHKETSNVNSSA